MNDDPRDELDRALSRGLSDLASGGGHADEVLAGMRPQLRRARTRYRATRIGGAAALVLLIGAGVALASPHGTSTKLKVSSHPTTLAPAPTTTRPARRHEPTTTTTRPVATQTTEAPAPPSATTSPRVTVPAPPISAKKSDHPPAPVTTTTVPSTTPDGMHSYSVEGGQITVRLTNGQLMVVSYSAAPGWTAALTSDQPTDVEVRFTYGESQSRIRLRVKDGVLVETQDE